MTLVYRKALEGEQSTTPIILSEYIRGDPELNQKVSDIHAWAREGVIDQETAERHLNAYLACAAWADAPYKKALIMPITDSPQFGNLPDLCVVIQRVLISQVVLRVFSCLYK